MGRALWWRFSLLLLWAVAVLVLSAARGADALVESEGGVTAEEVRGMLSVTKDRYGFSKPVDFSQT